MPRLFIKELTSVGLVASGDDPEAEVVLHKSKPEPKRTLAYYRKQLEDHQEFMKSRPPITKEKPSMPTKGQITKIRDQWVDQHRGKDETVFEARSRFWKENPDVRDLSRNATPDSVEDKHQSFGETVSAAIEKRARQYHLDDPRTLDKSIPELKVHIRKTLPALVRLERNQESVDIAKSAYAQSVDPQVQAALEFVKTWSE